MKGFLHVILMMGVLGGGGVWGKTTAVLAGQDTAVWAEHFSRVAAIKSPQLGYNPTPAPNNPDLDCKMRELAYSYGKSLLPSYGSFPVLFDALELHTRCNVSWEGGDGLEGVRGELEAMKSSDFVKAAHTFYVDANKGSDSNPGTESEPFRTIGKGVEAARATGEVGNAVLLREGTFFVGETIELGVADSGLTIAAYPGESPVVVGATPLEGLSWSVYNQSSPYWTSLPNTNNVFDQVAPRANGTGIVYAGEFGNYTTCEMKCEAEAGYCTGWTWHDDTHGEYSNLCYFRVDGVWNPTGQSGVWSGREVAGQNVWVTDVDAGLEFDVFGMLRGDLADSEHVVYNWSRTIRARYPNVYSTELTFFPTGWVSGGVNWGPIRPPGPYTPVYVAQPNDSSQLLFQNFQGGYGGACDIFSPNFSYWCGEDTHGGGGVPFIQPWGATFDQLPEGLEEGRATLHTWREAHWATWDFVLDRIDGNVVNWTVGGFQGARGAKNGAEYWIDNSMSLLDHPNEFYFDLEAHKLYYYPNSTKSAPSGVFAPLTLAVIFNISGTMDAPVKGISFQNLKIVGGRSTYLDPHAVPSGGDWSLESIAAVVAEGTEDFQVTGCVFERNDGNALLLRGYNLASLVSDNEFAWTGSSNVILWGRADGMDVTKGEVPTDVVIRRNLMREMGVGPPKQESCVFSSKTNNFTMDSNICMNGPRAGVNMNDACCTSGPLITHNLFFDLCRESSDHGAYNSWDRQVYKFLVDGQPAIHLQTPIRIDQNFFMANYGSSMNIDSDDGSAFYLATRNVDYGGGMKSDFGGHDLATDGNLQIYAKVYSPTCFSVSPTISTKYKNYYHNATCILDPTTNPSVYNLPGPVDTSNPDNNMFAVGGNTIYVANGLDATLHAGGKSYTLRDWLQLGLDKGTTVSGDIPSNTEIAAMSAKMLGM